MAGATQDFKALSCEPAKCLNDCIVGPSENERLPGSPCWGSDCHRQREAASSIGGKRKRNSSDADTSTSKGDSVSGVTPSNFDRAVQTFQSSGCCVIPNVLPAHFVKNCLQKATADFELLNQELEARRLEARSGEADAHQVATAYRVDYREMVDRDGGRRDVRLDLDRYPYAAPGLIYNSTFMPLIQALLAGSTTCNTDDADADTQPKNPQQLAVNLLYMGVMWARRAEDLTPMTPHQNWHGDGGHLFDHCHLPPHCINVFLPLIDVASEHGPTEVQPGSHRLGHFSDESHANIGLEAKAGDAIIFDYRLKHRGSLNTSDQNRPILYLAYARPWFRDSGNTRSGQSIFPIGSGRRSRPWSSRILTGQPMPMMQGFDDIQAASTTETKGATAAHGHTSTNENGQDGEQQQHHDAATSAAGSGERWILFKMNVQLDDREENIVVHAGDIPLEVASQFCLQHQLSHDFVPVLTDTIQQQISHAAVQP